MLWLYKICIRAGEVAIFLILSDFSADIMKSVPNLNLNYFDLISIACPD